MCRSLQLFITRQLHLPRFQIKAVLEFYGKTAGFGLPACSDMSIKEMANGKKQRADFIQCSHTGTKKGTVSPSSSLVADQTLDFKRK